MSLPLCEIRVRDALRTWQLWEQRGIEWTQFQNRTSQRFHGGEPGWMGPSAGVQTSLYLEPPSLAPACLEAPWPHLITVLLSREVPHAEAAHPGGLCLVLVVHKVSAPSLTP